MDKNIEQIKRWKRLPEYQGLLRQIHVDAFVGLKNGASIEEIRKALKNFAEEVKKDLEAF
jgi:glycine cleavage system regulatory protein